MGAYRLYGLDDSGRIQLADWISVTSEASAVKQARQITSGFPRGEIWQKDRLVARFESTAAIA